MVMNRKTARWGTAMAVLTWVGGWALWSTGTLPFAVLAVLFALWVASFVGLEQAVALEAGHPGILRYRAWSCLWTTLALAVAMLVFL